MNTPVYKKRGAIRVHCRVRVGQNQLIIYVTYSGDNQSTPTADAHDVTINITPCTRGAGTNFDADRLPIILVLRSTGAERDRPADHDSPRSCSTRREARHLRGRERIPCLWQSKTTLQSLWSSLHSNSARPTLGALCVHQNPTGVGSTACTAVVLSLCLHG